MFRQGNDDIFFRYSGLVCGPVLFDRQNLYSGCLCQFKAAGEHPGNRDVAAMDSEVAAHHSTVLEQLWQDVFGHVNGDGKANALGRLDNGGVDADHQGAAIDQRTAAVARVESGVGLDDVVHQVTGDAPQGPAQGADHPGGDGGLKAERAPDRHHELANTQRRGVPEASIS